MFSKLSRYRNLPDEVTVDSQGRRQLSKSLRLLTVLPGQFLQAVDGNDRLDHLAYKYYKEPRKWWRICDANPEFLSPWDLLGKSPVVTQRFPLQFTGGGDPPWALLLASAMALVGVEAAGLDEDAETGAVAGVVVAYNTLNLDTAGLAACFETAGFSVSQPQAIGRLGKPIVIPPDGLA